MTGDRLGPDLRDLREAWELLLGPNPTGGGSAPPDPTPPEGPDPYGNPDPEWLGIDWRQHLRSIEVGGAQVNYVEMGPAEAAADPAAPGREAEEAGICLVLVHGLAGCWQNWLEQIPHFARRHRVLALDLPGFGHSPMPPWEISIPAYGRLVCDFCDAAGVGDAALVGHSLGGFVAAEALCTQPDRFQRLVLAAAAGISTAGIRPEPAALAARIAIKLAPLAFTYQRQALQRPKLRRSAFGTIYHEPAELRPELLYEQYANGSGKPAFLPAVSTLVGYDFTERLEAVATETLIVWGRDDQVVPPADALEYGRLLANSSSVIFDRTGHCLQLERPVRFNRVLGTFLGAD